jgi:hypothetical protein
MLLFSTPALLALAPVVAALGLWTLLRGRHRAQPVSSTRLWQNLAGEASGARSRKVDPLWLLVFLAAVFTALALPGPRWQSGRSLQDLPSAKVEWAVRSLADNPPSLFLKITEPHHLAATLRLEPSQQHVATADAIHGLTLPLPTEISTLRLFSDHALLAAATFTRPDRPPFALLTRAAPGRAVDPALYRVFAINPAAVVGNVLIHPAVLLVDDPKFTLNDISPDTLVIGAPDTPLPGITLGPSFKPAAPPVSVAMPKFVQLASVQVTTATQATLTADWTIAATLDNHPFLATRRLAPNGPTLVWLASRPVADTNWPLNRSFVLYFSDLLARTFPTDTQSNGRALDWRREDLPPATLHPPAVVGLTAPLGAAAIVLLAAAALMLAWRGRALR